MSTQTSGASGFFSSFRLKSTDKNWRGKYLRALNICPREGEVHRKRAVTDGGGTRRARPQQASQPTSQAAPTSATSGIALTTSRSSRSHSSSASANNRRPTPSRDDDVGSRTHHLQAALAGRHGAVPTERRHHEAPSLRRPIRSNSSSHSSSTSTRNSFGIVRKPTVGTQRNKQPTSEPLFALEERLSAPISIPTPTTKSSAISIGKVSDLDGGSSRLNKLSSRTESHYLDNNRKHGSQLLSWEEPVAMMAAAGAVSAGLPLDQSTTAKLGIDNSLYDMYDNYVDECGDTEEEDDDDDDKDTEADDLFNEGAMFEMEDFDNELSSNNISKAQRRRRSSSLVGSNQRPNLLPRPHSVRQMSTNKDLFSMQTLPESFVPPHQMIERDCFSIGLRDQLKRRPSGRI